MNNYIIRKLNDSDTDYKNYLYLINQFRSTAFTLEEYKNLLSKIENNTSIWVIEYNDELIGTATILYEYKFIRNIVKLAHIEDVCIDQNHRNKGIGHLLITHVVNEANKEKCYKVTLDCDETLEKFYKNANIGLEKKGIQMTKYFMN
jgi:predicted GNAT family N-acyltransferase